MMLMESYEFLNFKILKILIVFCFFSFSFTCRNINKGLVVDHNNLNCGTVILNFNKNEFEGKPLKFVNTNLYQYYKFSMIINEKIEFNNETISDGVSIKKSIPEGKIKLTYSIGTSGADGVYYYTGLKNRDECFRKRISVLNEKEININIKPGQSLYLKIIKKGEPEKKCAWVQAGWLGSFKETGIFQQIEFVIDRIDDTKNK